MTVIMVKKVTVTGDAQGTVNEKGPTSLGNVVCDLNGVIQVFIS